MSIYIGTSGWVYPDWRGKFYPQDLPQSHWLEFYSQNFKTVEINATFYHQMRPQVFQSWYHRTPEDFLFSVKMSRFITHIRRLQVDKKSLEIFFDQVSNLKEKLGPILVQLPPRWKASPERLEEFLKFLSKKYKFAFEFRDESWLTDAIYQILKKYNTALVIQDSPSWPTAEVTTADFVYLRFHGKESLYSSWYNKDELAVWAKKIKSWQKQGLDIYAYFNNDVKAHAIENAKTLIKLTS